MNHEQAEWMLRALEKQAAALERIAAAVEQMVKKAQAEPVELTSLQTWGGPVTGLPEHSNGV